MSKQARIGDELPDTVPDDRKKTNALTQPLKFNTGVASFLSFVVALTLGFFGYQKILELAHDVLADFSTAFSSQPSNTANMDDLIYIQLMLIGGAIMLIISLAFAGASLITDQAGILGAFVLLSTLFPFLYTIGSIFFGWPPIISFFLQ